MPLILISVCFHRPTLLPLQFSTPYLIFPLCFLFLFLHFKSLSLLLCPASRLHFGSFRIDGIVPPCICTHAKLNELEVSSFNFFFL